MSQATATPQDGDHALVDELSRRHRATLLRYFARRGFGPADAEDASQDVLLRLVRRAGLSNEVADVDAYLFAAAAHVAADMARGWRRHVSQPYDDALHAEADLGPEDIAEGREALAAVIVALRELPERCRNVFLLVRLEQMAQPEVARRLGISLSSVEKNLRRATEYLGRRAGRR